MKKSDSNILLLDSFNKEFSKLKTELKQVQETPMFPDPKYLNDLKKGIEVINNNILKESTKSEMIIKEIEIKNSEESLNIYKDILNKIEAYKNYIINCLLFSEQKLAEQVQQMKMIRIKEEKPYSPSISNKSMNKEDKGKENEKIEKKLVTFIESTLNKEMKEYEEGNRLINSLQQYMNERTMYYLEKDIQSLNEENKSKENNSLPSTYSNLLLLITSFEDKVVEFGDKFNIFIEKTNNGPSSESSKKNKDKIRQKNSKEVKKQKSSKRKEENSISKNTTKVMNKSELIEEWKNITILYSKLKEKMDPLFALKNEGKLTDISTFQYNNLKSQYKDVADFFDYLNLLLMKYDINPIISSASGEVESKEKKINHNPQFSPMQENKEEDLKPKDAEN